MSIFALVRRFKATNDDGGWTLVMGLTGATLWWWGLNQ